MQVHVGCCGLQMARAKYYARFGVTEVQQTFYQPPLMKTLEGWRAGAPEGFEFTMKAWQLITHTPGSPTYRRLGEPVAAGREGRYGRFQLTDEVLAAWDVTLASARALRARFVLFQCPASFTPTAENVGNLRAFFSHNPEDRSGLVLGWEPRGGWPVELVRELAEELNLVYVVDPFLDEPLEQGPVRYLRLRGQAKSYHYTYTDEELKRLVGWLRETTYVMFNNVPMVQDAGRFIRLLDGKFSGPSATMPPDDSPLFTDH
jgi:uncharacterized protein YecE (DUF72 family)